MIFDPDVVSKLSACGVALVDAPGEVFANLMGYLGRDPNSQRAEDVNLFEEHMLRVGPHVRRFQSSERIDDLADGEICVTMGWSGDMHIARDRAAEAGRGAAIAYAIPREGAVVWFDNLAIPSDAPHPRNAHRFIDYLMEPEVAAAISNHVYYANANRAALPHVDEAVKADPSIYPPDDVKANLFPELADSPEFSRLLERAWTRVKNAR